MSQETLGRRSLTTRPIVLPTGLFLRLVGLLALLAAWLLASRSLGGDLMPGPVATWEFIVREYNRGTLFFHVWATMRRVLIAFSLAMVAGAVLGVAMGVSRVIDRLFEVWVVVGLTVPRIVLFVMAYLIIGLNDRSAIAALIVTVLPTIIVQVREGTRALDPKLIEMARSYRRPPPLIFRRVVVPQLMPYLIGTARGALSLSWKMIVLAELLGRTSGVGYQISFYFQFFNMKGIMAYGLTMMVVLAIIDFGFSGILGRAAFRWRKPVRLAG